MQSLLKSRILLRPSAHVRIPCREKHNSYDPLTDVDRVSIRAILKCPLNCLCSSDIEVDYKNVELLSQFISPVSGRIITRFSTGICAGKHRAIVKSIKRARISGLMPYTIKIPAYISPDLLHRSFDALPHGEAAKDSK